MTDEEKEKEKEKERMERKKERERRKDDVRSSKKARVSVLRTYCSERAVCTMIINLLGINDKNDNNHN